MNKETNNAKNSSKKYAPPMIALMLLAGTGAAALSYANISSAAAAVPTTSSSRPARTMPAAMGTVTAISGNTITLTGNEKGTATTYTVDASSAKIEQAPAMPAKGSTPPVAGTARPQPTTIAITDIKVGDTLMVEGTANGTNVTATTIMDGKFFGGMGGHGGPGFAGGQGARGTVTAVNGTSVTLTDTAKDGTSKTYTVDLSSAKIQKMETITASDIKVGDMLDARGEISGTTVTAKEAMDGTMPSAPAGN